MSDLFQGAFFREYVGSAEIVSFLNSRGIFEGNSVGSSDLPLDGVCDSRSGGSRKFVFLLSGQLSKVEALAESLILIDDIPDGFDHGTNQFCKVSDPRAAFMDTLEWLISSVGLEAHFQGFSQEAAISPDAKVADSAVVESGVEIQAGCTICAGAVIRSGTRIGKGTIIRENVVIGCDGVTVYRAADGRLLKFPHVGGVHIGSRTEIGANTVVVGGILAPTYVGSDVVIGNLCNVGHGAMIADGVWMSVGTLIGGHTIIHGAATIGMGVSVRDNVVIGEAASVGMGSVVVKNVEARHSMFGNPAKRMPVLKSGPAR